MLAVQPYQVEYTVINAHTAEVLTFLAQMQSQLATFGRYLQWDNKGSLPPVRHVVSDVACRNYESGLTVEVWLEAELQELDADGGVLAMSWWLDIVLKDVGWLLDGRVSWHGQQGEDTLFEPSAIFVDNFEAVQEEAPTMLASMFDKGTYILHERSASLAS